MAAWFAGFRRRLRPSLRIGADEAVSADLELSLDPAAEPPLLERLSIPKRMFERTGTRTLVVFDEFQDVAHRLRPRRRGDPQRDPAPRRRRQLRLRRLPARDDAEPVRRQAPRPLRPGPRPRPLPPRPRRTSPSTSIAASGPRTARSATRSTRCSTLAHGHPQRTMLLAHLLWERTPAGSRAGEEQWLGAAEQAMVEVQDELRAIWTGLSAGQRRVADGGRREPRGHLRRRPPPRRLARRLGEGRRRRPRSTAARSTRPATRRRATGSSTRCSASGSPAGRTRG